MKPLTVLTVAVLVLGACADTRDKPVPTLEPGESTCEDGDGDGFGEGCARGGDCDDRDQDVHVGCTRCVTPAEGCDCEEGSKPVSCYREPSTTDDGTIMCHEGTRYCREQRWSGCESIVSYPKPEELETQAVIDPTGTVRTCNDCTVNCFVVRDNLDPVDAGLSSNGQNVVSPNSGGLTLNAMVPDAGTKPPVVFDPSKCVLGTAPDQDCDGVPDIYDPYPTDKPFATTNPTLFMDIPPGQTAIGAVNLQFYLNSADVYFMVDQTSSMQAEKDHLRADLTTGDFINDPAYECSDYDFDRMPNNELKSQGIIGAIRCMIREANFGLGYFREIPITYAGSDNVTYKNLQDITTSIPAVVSAASLLGTVGNNDWPENGMLALYSMVTGNGFYFGPERRGLAPRTDCPTGTFGYPCFRNNAIPIVIMFTDAQFHAGPPNNDYPYNAAFLGMNAGTTTTHTPVKSTNENFSSALDLGDITTSNLTMIGNTSSMVSDYDITQVACGATGAVDDKSPDSLFKFRLTSAKTVTASTFGSDFDTTLSIFSNVPTQASQLPSYPNTNDTAASAYGFNNINNKFLQAAGDSSGLTHDYSAVDIGCGAAAQGKDAAFTFNLSTATRVALSTRGSSYASSISLFSGSPLQNSYTAITNTNNDAATQYPVGVINGRNRGFSGDSSNAAITSNYTVKQLGCGSSDTPPDAVYQFNLTQPTRVRVSSEDSTLRGVLALTSDSGIYLTTGTAGTTIETQATARNAGALDGRAIQYISGDTRAMTANYTGALTGCGAEDASRDAVFAFSLTSPRTVELDTLTSSLDTTLSLFRGTIGSGVTSVTATNTNETASTAQDLGAVNAKSVVTTGGSTSGMVANYTNAQVGCNSSSSARDAVYKFSVTSPTRVRIDTAGSSFDTVASLHQNLPVQRTVAVSANDAVASAYAVPVSASSSGSLQTLTGSTASLAANVAINTPGCAADFAGRDAVFRLDIATAGNYEINTEGSAFDTVLGVYTTPVQDAAPPTPVAQGTAGDKKISAVDVGVLDGRWVAYSGTTTGLIADFVYSGCSAAPTSPDVYYKFTLSSQRTVVISTSPSAFDTVLALTNSADVVQDCNNDFTGTASQITRTLNAGTYYAIIKGRTSTSRGTYRLTFRDTAVTDVSSTLDCDDNSGSGGITSKLSGYVAAGTYYAVVKGRTSTDSGAYRLNVVNLDAAAASNRLACDDNSAGSGDSQIEADLGVGDYFVVIKGTSNGASGSYSLRVSDRTNLPGFVTCNDDAVGTASRITTSLPAGNYYAVVRGSGTASGTYVFTLRDTATTYTTNYACNYNSGPSGTSLIEQDLAAGSYRVVVKGYGSADKGPYKINIRDVTAVTNNRLQCDATTGPGSTGYLERDLAAGSYTVVLQSTTAAGGGGYQLSVRDATQVSSVSAPYCNNNDIAGATYSKLSQSLPAGTYYALVKGNKTADKGQYQFNIGAVPTTTSAFVPPTWTQTKAALNAKKVRVLPVLSCRDDSDHGDVQGDCVAARNQAKALANATNAVSRTLQPLVYDIDTDGSGLSKSIITGIGAITNYLEMNVSVRVVFDPDANPGFGVVVRAVDSAGDGCSGLVGNEHQKCAPGASPKFEVEFTNPAASPVKNNTNDPNGGYSFRAELIGDNQFVVDKVPIYIVPHNVSMPDPTPIYVPTGSYWQELSATKCVGTQRPDWHDLTWNANIPDGTTVSFAVCASDDKTQLSNCTPAPLAKVTGGRACTQNSDCTDGYCAATKTCHFVTGPSCSEDKDCPRGSSCKAGVCKFSGQPVYIGDALKDKNYTSNLRMQIGMTANTTANTAPTVYDWSLNYFCNSAQ
jgi:hypothetical protein